MTRILTRSDLLAVLDPARCLEALRAGFLRADAGPVAGQRVRSELPFPGTATVLVPGLLPGVAAYTVKVNAKFPDARPALRGVICLHSATDGELLALLDSATVTAWRTGLAAALVTDLLAVADPSASIGVIGAGAQAELMVTGLRALRSWKSLVVCDSDPRRTAEFAARHGGRAVASAAAVAEAADLVLLATWSRTPLLHQRDTHPGQHLTTLGVDEPGKRELAASVLRSALLVVDDRELASAHGVLADGALVEGELAEGELSPEVAAATAGEVLRGEHPGRVDVTQRTVYAPVGLPWQDLALSWIAYQEAELRDLGESVILLN